jgi:hypothetical protein
MRGALDLRSRKRRFCAHRWIRSTIAILVIPLLIAYAPRTIVAARAAAQTPKS